MSKAKEKHTALIIYPYIVRLLQWAEECREMDQLQKGRQTRIFRDPIIDEFPGSGFGYKGLGHTRRRAQKIIEWEKIPE